jgi:hypothetical protein
MFWNIFIDSVVLILLILVVGWVIDFIIHKRSQ